MSELFRRGGPHNIRKTGRDQYSMNISIPADADGMIGRECTRSQCSPAYFKVKLGTGITDGHEKAFCPYCHADGDPNDFATKAQLKYVERIVEREVTDGLDRMFKDALGLGPSGKKKFGRPGDMVRMEMSYKPSPKRPVGRPLEEELRRDVTCPKCTLEHAVFGLATWCPDCGADIFMTHAVAELEVVRRMLGHVDKRHEELGPRVAARDVENALEDVVSIFETVLKIVTRRHLLASGQTEEEVEDVFKRKVRNTFQSVERGAVLFKELVGQELFAGLPDSEVARLANTFEKRHPITHNLGMLDRKYLEKARSGELEGREVRVSVAEVTSALDFIERALSATYARAFPPS